MQPHEEPECQLMTARRLRNERRGDDAAAQRWVRPGEESVADDVARTGGWPARSRTEATYTAKFCGFRQEGLEFS